MKNYCRYLMSLLLALCGLIAFGAATSFAGWDDFLGDSVIYTAGGGARKPNILFIIDNSKATLNSAPGVPYRPETTYSGTNAATEIFQSDNKGNFISITPKSILLEELTDNSCAGIIDTLNSYGTYSGSFVIDKGRCVDSTGASYALGNYLNYLATEPPVVKVAGVDGHDYFLVKDHTSSESLQPGQEPYVEAVVDGELVYVDAPWKEYWAPAGTKEQGDAWESGKTYTAEYGEVTTQKEIMYRALTSVIASKYNVANFGLATYGANNKGANIFEDVKTLTPEDVSSVSGVPPFFQKIPGSGVGGTVEVKTNDAGPQRSQAEALYDVGYYLDGNTPYTAISTAKKIDLTIKNYCGNTHVIFITNGLSNGDNDPLLRDGYPTFNADGGIDYPDPLGADVAVDKESSYGQGTHHLDDVAWYLREELHVKTHVLLAFQNYDPMIARAAKNGGGMFANVFNEQALVRELEKMIIPIIDEVDTAFVAPVVPANPENRTFSGSRLYLGFFYPKQNSPWYGNLKKYGIGANGTVVDKNGTPATCPDYDADGSLVTACINMPSGAFKDSAVSYWSETADGGSVEAGGVGEVLYDKPREDRKIYTYLGGNDLLTHESNLFSKRDAIYGAMGAGTDTEKGKIVDFVYGTDVWDFDDDGDAEEKRNWLLGDILHSKPLVVGYNTFDYEHEDACPVTDSAWSNVGGVFEGINKSVIFVGANDGMLHAFRDCDGENLWSFIPPDLLPKLATLNTKEYPSHQYFVDGTPTAFIFDRYQNKIIDVGDRVILLFGLRRGGGLDKLDESASRGAYYALDVTNPVEPLYLGRIAGAEMGETWSQPTLARIRHNVGTEETPNEQDKIVFFVGAGYDNNEDLRFGNTQTFPGTTTAETDTTAPSDDAYTDNTNKPKTSAGTSAPFNPRGRGIYCYEIGQYVPSPMYGVPHSWNYDNFGTLIGSITLADNPFSFPSDLSVLDTSFNGYADYIYAGDTGGQIWRFNVGSSDVDSWSAQVVFAANAKPSDLGYAAAQKGRKVFYRPSLVIKPGYVSLVFGTGDRAHPLNLAVADRLYMVKDYLDSTTTKTESDLLDVTTMPLSLTGEQRLSLESGAGWYIRLPAQGEKVLSSALVFGGVAYFTTYTPSTEEEVINSCSEGNLGQARLWAVSFRDGTAAFRDLSPDSSTLPTTAADRDRAIVLGSGIPSGMVPTINEDGSSGGFIGCGAGLCKGPDTVNRLIYPLFWKQW